jgi:hypothetical protein
MIFVVTAMIVVGADTGSCSELRFRGAPDVVANDVIKNILLR